MYCSMAKKTSAYNEGVPRKPKPLPIPESVDPKHRFDTVLTALLAVRKDELQKVEDKLKQVRESMRTKKGKNKG
jgi:hypothetical protein